MLARGGPIEPDAPFSLPTVAGAQQAPHFGSDLGHQREHARARLLIGLTDQLFEMVQERLAEAKRGEDGRVCNQHHLGSEHHKGAVENLRRRRSEENTSEIQSLMRNSYAVL